MLRTNFANSVCEMYMFHFSVASQKGWFFYKGVSENKTKKGVRQTVHSVTKKRIKKRPVVENNSIGS